MYEVDVMMSCMPSLHVLQPMTAWFLMVGPNFSDLVLYICSSTPEVVYSLWSYAVCGPACSSFLYRVCGPKIRSNTPCIAPSTRCDFRWTILMFVNIHGNRSMLEHSWTFYNISEQCSTMLNGRPHGSIFIGHYVSTKIHRCCSIKVETCIRGLTELSWCIPCNLIQDSREWKLMLITDSHLVIVLL